MDRIRSRRAASRRLISLAFVVAAAACARTTPSTPAWRLVPPWTGEGPHPTGEPTPTAIPDPVLALLPPTREPGVAYATPTPDTSRPTPVVRSEPEYYAVQPGDTLNQIAYRFTVGLGQVMTANGIVNPDLLSVGQLLFIPAPSGRTSGPSFKVMPDSEIVYGPASALLDVPEAVAEWGGYLSRFGEEVEERTLSGAQIVVLVAQRYSVNPRLLLAVLEHQAHWLTRADVAPETLIYPLGYAQPRFGGLFGQLSWAADALNSVFYAWRAGWAGPFLLADGQAVIPGAGINAGTAAVQGLFAQLYGSGAWEQTVGESGFYQTFVELFGTPFDLAVEPVVPPDLTQPPLQLPFDGGAVWSFTGGPHSAWGVGAAWAAIDFAPPGYALGCVQSEAWVVAAADGVVLRSDQGEVIQDLDGDGREQTGWVLMYLHVESRDRVAEGTRLQAGDRIGHPSCEGGVSNGTHLHLARRYNGEWIPADTSLPFELDGWVSAGLGREYDGTLTRGSVVLEACACRFPGNQISR